MNCFGNDKCKVERNDQLGRYVVASKDLRAGELLLCEKPAIIGPYWDSKVCCLNCYSESMKMCKKCKIAPICFRCKSHDSNECDFFKKSGLPINFLLDHFDVLTILRCIILSRDASRREQFEAISAMESHCDKRRGSAIWKVHDRKVVQPLLATNGFLGKEETAEWMQRLCGILDVNSFEVRTPNFQEIPVRGIYPKAALLPHDCISNTFITVDAEKQLRVYASVDIGSGKTVFNNYTSTLFGTSARQEHLREGKYFDCECQRCLDPTELQTHVSSIRCQMCQGLIVFHRSRSEWQCDSCCTIQPNDAINQMLAMARLDLYASGSEIGRIEIIIAKYTKQLNANHCLVLEMKQKLAAILRSMTESAANLTVDELKRLLQRKVELCGELLPVLRVLKPGISRLTAIAQFEHFTAIFHIAQLNLQQKIISTNDYINQLIAAERIAKESVAMLIYEPPSTPEGDLARLGMQHLRHIRQLIEKHHKGIRTGNKAIKAKKTVLKQ